MPLPADDTSMHPLLRTLLGAAEPAVMGILNITPDSFSDGGQFVSPDHALAQARRMIADGARVLDIGAESTRPGATPVEADEEMRRLQAILPAVTALRCPVSIDTMKARVAEWALGKGAVIVNDVWGLQRDADMARIVAAHGAPVILMHNRERADPALDIIADIKAFFSRSLEIAARAGILTGNIVLDPGIGFGKTPQQSLRVLQRLSELTTFDLPLLVGASRKRFIDHVSPAPPSQRLGGSLAALLFAQQTGGGNLRAHDVAETVQALRVARAIESAR